MRKQNGSANMSNEQKILEAIKADGFSVEECLRYVEASGGWEIFDHKLDS